MTATTVTQVIAPFRAQVTELVAGTGVPTYGWLPDDVAHLPVCVVGRPSLREADTAGMMTMTLDVTLLGRRIADEDAQAELDAQADQLFAVLGGTRNVRTDFGFLRCVGLLPGTVFVAGLECPAYIASVSTETLTC
jgi:hypothetical protein